MKFRSDTNSADQLEPVVREIPSTESPSVPEKPPPETNAQSTPPSPKKLLVTDLKTKRGRRRSKSEAALKDLSLNGTLNSPNSPNSDGLRRAIGETHLPGANVGFKKRRQSSVCDCLKSGEHHPNVALDTTFTGTVEKIYNLMFTSGFMRKFLEENEKCTGKYVRERQLTVLCLSTDYY